MTAPARQIPPPAGLAGRGPWPPGRPERAPSDARAGRLFPVEDYADPLAVEAAALRGVLEHLSYLEQQGGAGAAHRVLAHAEAWLQASGLRGWQ